MCFKFIVLALTCLGGLAAQPVAFKQKRDVDNPGMSNAIRAKSGYYENLYQPIEAAGKYFQDIYVAMEKPNELQFGHVAETPNNWEQRFEKIDLANIQHQGKVRWGDKNGGYGEHYWDFNHDGQKNDEEGGEETEKKPKYAVREDEQEAEAPEPTNQPTYISHGVQATQESKIVPTYVSAETTQRGKREQGLLKDVEFINDRAKSLILDGHSQKHGGNYRHADDYRGKREQHVINEEDLIFESDRGTFRDRKTGIEYELKPVY